MGGQVPNLSAQTCFYEVTCGMEEMDTALPSPACESDSDGDDCEMMDSGSAVLEHDSPVGDPVWDSPRPTADALPVRLGPGSCFPSASTENLSGAMDHELTSMAKMADLQKQLAIALERALTLGFQPVLPLQSWRLRAVLF